MKKNKNNTAVNASVQPKKVIVMGKKRLSEAEIEALQARLAAAEAELEKERATKAELEAKVKTSVKREPKAPNSYNVLQPLFVALRGNIGKGIVKNSILIDIFKNAADALGITIDNKISVQLVEKTVQHNSVSNIAKADTLASAEGRKEAYLEMLSQAETMLENLESADIDRLRSNYNAVYAAKVAKMK